MNTTAFLPTTFSKRLQEFLFDFSPSTAGASPNTLASYCDAFRQYLRYRSEEDKIDPDRLDLADFSTESVEGFLNWIERSGCKAVTRNQRLAALHSFCKYLVRKEPLYIHQVQQILAIPMKKHPTKKIVDYLSVDEMSALLQTVPTATKISRRDAVLLSLMYDTAARVQEIADLTVGDVKLATKETSLVYLTGKGRKTRSVPLSFPMFDMLSKYIKEGGFQGNSPPLFVNRGGTKLTRHGIAFILSRYTVIAGERHPALKAKTISPHTFRHSKAMHLLQAGVDLIKIRDFLGHESISTTEIYARTNDTDIRAALMNAACSEPTKITSWHNNTGLMERLSGFAKRK